MLLFELKRGEGVGRMGRSSLGLIWLGLVVPDYLAPHQQSPAGRLSCQAVSKIPVILIVMNLPFFLFHWCEFNHAAKRQSIAFVAQCFFQRGKLINSGANFDIRRGNLLRMFIPGSVG